MIGEVTIIIYFYNSNENFTIITSVNSLTIGGLVSQCIGIPLLSHHDLFITINQNIFYHLIYVDILFNFHLYGVIELRYFELWQNIYKCNIRPIAICRTHI
jgi:hypothetical protein